MSCGGLPPLLPLLCVDRVCTCGYVRVRVCVCVLVGEWVGGCVWGWVSVFRCGWVGVGGSEALCGCVCVCVCARAHCVRVCVRTKDVHIYSCKNHTCMYLRRRASIYVCIYICIYIRDAAQFM